VATNESEEYRIVAAPMHFSGHRTAPRGPAPELGQHTEEVLLESGLSWDAIGALRDGGGLG
jgi:formyl-CoA transferase